MSTSVPRRRLFAVPLLVLAVPLAGGSARAQGSAGSGGGSSAPGEARLLARLIAPCCWTQTLDVHESEISASLRREIRARLLAGESPDAIEDSIVARYGERIRAVPRGEEVGGHIPLVVGLAMLAAAGALLAMVRRWLGASAARPAPLAAKAAGTAPDPYDGKLDDELRAFDE
jgi:cytochrome c-type biogenesis protein CcmH